MSLLWSALDTGKEEVYTRAGSEKSHSILQQQKDHLQTSFNTPCLWLSFYASNSFSFFFFFIYLKEQSYENKKETKQ